MKKIHPDKKTAKVLLPAPLWKRLFAILYDTFLLFGITMIYGYLSYFITVRITGATQESIEASPHAAGNPLMFAGWLLVIYLFFYWFWSRNQQTLGMQAWRLKIVSDREGEAITAQQALIRCLVAPLSMAMGGIGFFWCLFGDKRTWQDIASGSRIIHIPKEQKQAAPESSTAP